MTLGDRRLVAKLVTLALAALVVTWGCGDDLGAPPPRQWFVDSTRDGGSGSADATAMNGCGTQTRCEAPGREAVCASLLSDNAHCGACGHACVAPESCVLGKCGVCSSPALMLPMPPLVALPNGGKAAASGDFDGDGKLDVAIAGSGFAIVLGNGDGTFRAPVSYAEGTAFGAIVTGDVDGDRRLDVIVVQTPSAAVSLYGNNGDGTFTLRTTLPTTAGTITLADLDRDGDLDLLATNTNLDVFKNNGQGDFTKASYPTPGLKHVGIGDFNGDGAPDIAAFSFILNQTKFGFHMNTGTGAFSAFAELYDLSSYDSNSLAVADFNGDGKDDVAWVLLPQPANVNVLYGDGQGKFSGGVVFYDYGGPLTVADLDGDGRHDFATSAGSVTIRLSTERFGARFVYPTTGFAPSGVAAGDFNGDHAIDVAWIGGPLTGTRYLGVLLNSGMGEMKSPFLYAPSRPSTNASLVDLNGDGKLDLVSTDDAGLRARFASTPGRFLGTEDYSLGGVTPSVFVDVDGDGKNDVLGVTTGPSQLATILNRGETFASPAYTSLTAPAARIASGELDGDGKIDLVLVHTNDDKLGVHKNQGGSFSAAVEYAAGARPIAVEIADVSGDATRDIVVLNEGSISVGVLTNAGNGTFAARTELFADTAAPKAVLARDIDGDGKVDLVTLKTGAASTVSTWLRRGAGFSARADYALGNGATEFTFADVDGDGALDILALDPVLQQISMLLNSKQGTFGPAALYWTAFAASNLLAHDLDGNGKADFAVTAEEYFGTLRVVYAHPNTGHPCAFR